MNMSDNSYPGPLETFTEGQWWINELDNQKNKSDNLDFKRAVAVVHHLLLASKVLQQKVNQLEADLLQSQASEASRADWLWIQLMDWCKSTGRAPAQENSLFNIVSRMRESTPPNTAELEAYVESEIEKRLGEPVAWMNSANGVVINKKKKQLADYSLFDDPLYSVKDKQ